MINVFETSFEARERRFQIEKLYHGETVDLVGTITTDGVLKNITGYSVSGVFQPTSMNGSEEFYELSADIVDNKVIVHWEKGKDFGEPSYMVWALLTDGNDASYPIAWRLDMAYSPSFPLSDLAPIPKAIDFSKYELLNAPWLELSAVGDLPYLPLSGGTVTGEFAVENFIQSDATNITLGKNNELTQTANTVVVGNGNSVEGSEMVRSTAIVVGTDNLARGLARKQILVGASLSANTSAPAIGIGYYGTIAQDSVAVGEGPNFTKMQVGMEAVAIGIGISSVADDSIAIGHGANTGNVRTVQLGEGKPTAAYQFNVFDKNVLSGSGFILNRDRIPYLDEYETKADATAEHQAIVDGLSAYAKKEDIPEVPTDLSAFTNSPGYLTAHQSLSDYYTKEEADGKFLTAHQDLTDYATKEYVQSEISDFITEDALTGLATKEEVQAVDDKLSNYAEKEELTAYATKSELTGYATKGEISDFITEEALTGLATKEEVQAVDDKLSDYAEKDELTAYAQLSDIPELPEDIVRKDELSNYAQTSALTAYAEKEELTAYAQLSDLDNISVDMSPCLSSAEFSDVEELGEVGSVSNADIVAKINLLIQKLKRTWKDPRYTWVTYKDNSVSSFNIVGELGANSIPNKSNARTLEIGTDVTSIGNSAFFNCREVSFVVIPSGVTSIGQSAFSTCLELTSVTIPDSVTSIGNQAFNSCYGLTSVTIPGITSIGASAFADCIRLTSIIFGGVTSIGRFAFERSSSCLTFDYSSTTSIPTLANTDAFASTNANKKIIVPDALYEDWKAANNWNSSTNGIVDAITKASEA